MGAGSEFAQWVRATVHEGAPDHSVHLIETGYLRKVAAEHAEMLQVLERARSRLDAHESDCPELMQDNDDLAEVVDAAIAKARGEA